MSGLPTIRPEMEWLRNQEEKKKHKHSHTNMYILVGIGIIILLILIIWIVSMVYSRRTAPSYTVLSDIKNKANSIAPKGPPIAQ
jgi:cytoskeletal protein RodZ